MLSIITGTSRLFQRKSVPTFHSHARPLLCLLFTGLVQDIHSWVSSCTVRLVLPINRPVQPERADIVMREIFPSGIGLRNFPLRRILICSRMSRPTSVG